MGKYGHKKNVLPNEDMHWVLAEMDDEEFWYPPLYDDTKYRDWINLT